MPKKSAVSSVKKIHKKIAIHGRRLVKHAKDHFIPHKSNDHHPHVLKHHVLAGYSAIIILLKILVIAVTVVYPSIHIQAMALTPLNVLTLVNQARRSASLPELNHNTILTASANDKANDMLVNQYFDHYSSSGVSPWFWIKRAGYRYLSSAENLAVHYTSAEGVYDAWMSSPDHMKNILNPKFTDVGIGMAEGNFEDMDSIFVVQHFGQPYEAAQKTQTTKKSGSAKEPTQPTAQNTATTTVAPTDDVGAVLAAVSNLDDAQNETPTEPATMTKSSPEWASNSFDATQTISGNKLFGLLDAHNINTLQRGIYIFFIVFLSLALILSISKKMHVKKPEVIAHALGVIGLIVFLWLM
ncbi:MAG: CAP domain-containing protein [Patescibacteria group bacterium]|nr:CAP domain-containing protein [Patescibacteria group bacterium]